MITHVFIKLNFLARGYCAVKEGSETGYEYVPNILVNIFIIYNMEELGSF